MSSISRISQNAIKKVAIITGGCGGIGKQTCLTFAKNGYNVVSADINEASASKLTQAQQVNDGRIHFHRYDANIRESCEDLVIKTKELFGRIDVLFNNVGIQPTETKDVPLHLLEERHWDAIMNVNLKSYYWMCKFVIPEMLGGGGVIVNNASIQAFQHQKGTSAYAATKGAVVALTRQLAVEYGSKNIRVNVISPGSIVTPMMKANTPMDYAISNTPLGVLGEPEDVAELALFLASDRAKWITGQNFIVDGGITTKGGWAPL